MTRFAIQVVLILVVLAAAWRFGARPEKAVATIYAAMLFLDVGKVMLVGQWDDGSYGSLVTFRFLLDLAALVGVASVALLYDRWWTLWVGSAQLLALCAHLLKAVQAPLNPLVYSTMERWPVWIAIVVTGLGTYLHWTRHRRTGGT